MDTTRKRARAFVEWVLAAALLATVLVSGLSLLGGLRRVAPVAQVMARETETPTPPSIVPSKAVSVPLLPLTGSIRIQVGEFATDVMARIEGIATPGADAVDRRPNGDRMTREFSHAGGSFYLVTESAAAGAAPRVTGIFVP